MQSFQRVVKSIVLNKIVFGLVTNVRIINVNQHQLQGIQMPHVNNSNQEENV